MTKYRKKPVIIDAIKWIPCEEVSEELIDLGLDPLCTVQSCVVIHTLEGRMIAHPGDYIIRGIKGEFYPCKADIFEATYEKVEDCENA